MFSGEMTVLFLRDFCRPLRHYKYCSSCTYRAIDDDPLGCASYRKGLCKTSRSEIQWKAYHCVDFLRRFWLDFTIISVSRLELVTHLTKSSSLALRSLLHCNRTLERLILEELATREDPDDGGGACRSSKKHRRERAVPNRLSKPTQH
jgi:hypothetical protein